MHLKLFSFLKKTKKITRSTHAISFIVLSAFILGFAVYLVYFVLNNSNKIENYLPADTNAFFEINLDALSYNDKIYLNNYLKTKGLDRKISEDFVNTFLSLNKEAGYKNFLEDYFGVIFFDNMFFSNSSSKDENLVFFAKMKSNRKFKETLNQILLSKNKEQLEEKVIGDNVFYIYPGDQSFYFYVLDNLIFFAPKAENIQNILIASSEGKTLKNNPNFRNVLQNKEQFRPLFAYIDVERFLVDEKNTISPKDVFRKNVMELVDFVGLSGSFDRDTFVVDTYLNLSPEIKKAFQDLPIRNKYRGKFSVALDDRYDFVLGGENLKLDFDILKKAFEKIHPSINLLLDGIMEAYKDKFFGEDLDMIDFVNAFSKEYQLAFDLNEEGIGDYLMMLEISNIEGGKDLILKAFEFFEKNNPFVEPKIETVTLEDGTSSQKMVSNIDEIKELKSYSKGSFEIHIKSFSESSKIFAIAVSDDVLIVSSSEDDLLRAIDGSNTFDSKFIPENVILSADQVSFYSNIFIQKHFKFGEVLKNYIDSMWSSEKFFDDGIYIRNFIKLNENPLEQVDTEDSQNLTTEDAIVEIQDAEPVQDTQSYE